MGRSRLIRFASAGAIVAALLLLLASSALAKATTTSAQWYYGTTKPLSVLTGKQSVTAAIGESAGPRKFTFSWYRGENRLSMEAGEVSCIECFITNESSPAGVAVITGKLSFSAVTFTTPTTCAVSEGKFTSKPLVFEAHYMEGERWLLRGGPYLGETDFPITFINNGGPCIIAGTSAIQGHEFGEFISKTGVFAARQNVSFTPTGAFLAGAEWQLGGAPLAVTGILQLEAGYKLFGVQ
jgi:hypothetical protein